jgi:uncharacterized lipoprotein YddW (UPF0748 family)
VVGDIVGRYDVDGVHFDYLRYPTDEFDYSRGALAAFRADVRNDLDPADARRYDQRLAAEPLLYTQAFPARWRMFRAARLTALLARLRETVKAAKPAALLSVAVSPDPVEAADRRLQDWRSWLARDLIDVVCPMAYTNDGAAFKAQIAAVQETAGRHSVWAGIGAYRLSASQILDDIQAARGLGAGGVILFSYDSLIGPLRGADYLPTLGRAMTASK